MICTYMIMYAYKSFISNVFDVKTPMMMKLNKNE